MSSGLEIVGPLWDKRILLLFPRRLRCLGVVVPAICSLFSGSIHKLVLHSKEFYSPESCSAEIENLYSREAK